MSIRHLDTLLDPASVAVFGASNRPASLGALVWSHVRDGGFRGVLYAVNRKPHRLEGQPVFTRAADLPTVPELAVICTPAATVAGLVRELGELGTRAAVVLSPGLSAAQQQAVRAAARPHLLRILGPGGVGQLAPHIGLNTSTVPTAALPGKLALVSHSGSLVSTLLDWAQDRAIGFSHVVSLGEQLDVDAGDLLDYLANDAATRGILLYLEHVTSPRKFMSAARAAARNKPVIVLKAARTAQGRLARSGSAQAQGGCDEVLDAAIARAGMLRVDTLQQLFLAAETLTRFRGNAAQELTVLSNSASAAVMAVDAAQRAGIALAPPQPLALPQAAAPVAANPVLLPGDSPVPQQVQRVQGLLDQPDSGAVLVIHAPDVGVAGVELARALMPLADRIHPRLMACWLGESAAAEARQVLRDGGIASYATPEEAVQAFEMLHDYRRNQSQLLEAPPVASVLSGVQPLAEPDMQSVQALVRRVLAEGRVRLDEVESRTLLAAAGIDVAHTRRVPLLAQAATDAAEAIGYPVALKVVSADIVSRSAVGAVVLNLEGPRAVYDAAQAMLERVQALQPQARLEGFDVQAMMRQRHAHELLVWTRIDEVFGPVIGFGQGGAAGEAVDDHALALPPLNAALARALVQRTRVARSLQGVREAPAADQEALHAVLVAVARLLADLPALAELRIEPLILRPDGATALHAQVRLSAADPAGARNFAIRPYPADLVERLQWQDREITLRPIRPEDEARHLAFLEQLDPADIRLRVFYARRSIERSELARLTQIDYEREMAMLAVLPGPDGEEQTLGVVRSVTDPDNADADFGLIVRSDLKGTGLGTILMRKLIRTLRERGTRRLASTVLRENHGMLALARRLGFVQSDSSTDEGTVEIALDLQASPPAEHRHKQEQTR